MEKWKLHQYFEDGAVELYNLETDISEMHDLSKVKSFKTNELLQILKDWRVITKAFIPTQLNPDYIN